MRAVHRLLDAGDVEEEETRPGGVRLDCLGGKPGVDDLLVLLLRLFVLVARERNGADPLRSRAAAVDVRHAAEHIVGAQRFQLGVSHRHQLRPHAGQGNWLVAVVADDEQDGQDIFLVVGRDENLVFGRGVVKLDGCRHLLVGMRVLGSVSIGILRPRRNEVLGGA